MAHKIRQPHHLHQGKSPHGFSLVELLVAVIVFAVGLLGMMTLQTSSVLMGRSNNARSQALLLAEDMAERVRTNPAPFQDTSFVDVLLIPAQPLTNCITQRCTPAELASQDIYEWETNLSPQLPGATGTIIKTGNNITITINWNDTAWNGTPRASNLSINVGI